MMQQGQKAAHPKHTVDQHKRQVAQQDLKVILRLHQVQQEAQESRLVRRHHMRKPA